MDKEFFGTLFEESVQNVFNAEKLLKKMQKMPKKLLKLKCAKLCKSAQS